MRRTLPRIGGSLSKLFQTKEMSDWLEPAPFVTSTLNDIENLPPEVTTSSSLLHSLATRLPVAYRAPAQ